jgi:opacity protein-like surface antigen
MCSNAAGNKSVLSTNVKMHKKGVNMSKIVTLLATTAVAATIATSAVADSKNMTGVYVGGNIGYGAGTDHTKFINNAARVDIKRDTGMNGVVGGVHLGLQKDFGQFVAGLEGSASLSNTKGSFSSGIARTTFKRKNALGVAGRLGVKLNCWLVYAKLGYENAKFASHLNNFNVVPSSAGKNKRLNAFVPGIGFETMLNNNVLIGGEWTYSLYDGKNFNNTLRGVNVSDKHKPRIGDFKLRLGYKF